MEDVPRGMELRASRPNIEDAMIDKAVAGETSVVSRRAMLGWAGAGVTALALPSRAPGAIPAKTSKPMAGNLNLADVEIVDSHMHPVKRMLISQSYSGQMAEFSRLAVPPGEYQGKAALVTHAEEGARALVMDAPRRIGYFNYIARTYGVPATMAGFDSVTSRHIGSDADFSRYITAIFDREKITTVVLQAAEPAPTPPATLIPANRYVWTTVASEMTRLSWVKAKGLTALPDVIAAIDRIMEQAVANGCRGFKIMAAYYRSLEFSKPSIAEAESALQMLLAAHPAGTGVQDQPYFADPAVNRALATYEDFLFRHVFVKAGQLERPVIIHSAVALHPSLRVDFNDPRPLYAIFSDPDIQKAQTDFLLIHAGYPSQDVIAAFISQFPNVYTDVSFYSKYPGTLMEIYRSLLALGSSHKVLHGSDANSVPEEIGYCAWNTRAVLSTILSEYKSYLGWTQDDISAAARNVMHGNARRLFRISA